MYFVLNCILFKHIKLSVGLKDQENLKILIELFLSSYYYTNCNQQRPTKHHTYYIQFDPEYEQLKFI